MNSKSTQNQYPIFSGQLNKNISLSKKLIFSVVFISFLPSILGLLGFNFSSIKSVVIPQNLQLHIETSFTLLSGAFTHTILEWSAFVTAIFTALLTFISFKINKDVTAPIIGVSLFFAGIMDAFHVLASDHLIQVTAKNADFIPFTWTLCRVFNPLILIVGLSLILTRQPKSRLKHNFQFVLIISFIFGFFAYGVIHISAISSILPHIIFPNAIITRPYDLLPLLLFIIVGVLSFLLYKKSSNIFLFTVILSMIPNILTQVHMTFGSTALFDHHFNIAHFLKILAYLIPFIGLCIEYVYANQQLQIEIQKRKKIAEDLVLAKNKADDANRLKSEFLNVVSHELRTPLK